MVMLNPPQGWIMLSYCLGSFCPDKAVVNGLICCNCKCIIQDHSLVIMQATNKKTEKKNAVYLPFLTCLSLHNVSEDLSLWKPHLLLFHHPETPNTATVSSSRKVMNWGLTYQMQTTYILTCWLNTTLGNLEVHLLAQALGRLLVAFWGEILFLDRVNY